MIYFLLRIKINSGLINVIIYLKKVFSTESNILLPIFDFVSGKFTGENAILDQEIFNNPIRKDIILRNVLYLQNYKKKTFKWVKSKAEVAGSNKKPFAQKKTGRAQQGDKRAPNLYKGGRAHGARPREFYFPLNKRVQIQGKYIFYERRKINALLKIT